MGTATEVGKTWVGAAVLTDLRSRGVTVSARKPVQSFDPVDPNPSDRDVLAGASGEDPAEVCPSHRCYPIAFAPPMAAAALGLPSFTIADLAAEMTWPTPPPTVRWVEGVGGVRSPIADDGDNLDLCDRIHADLVVLVADAGLGTVNAVALSSAALDGRPHVIMLNRYDHAEDLHRRNLAWLVDRLGLNVVTTVRGVVNQVTGTAGG